MDVDRGVWGDGVGVSLCMADNAASFHCVHKSPIGEHTEKRNYKDDLSCTPL